MAEKKLFICLQDVLIKFIEGKWEIKTQKDDSKKKKKYSRDEKPKFEQKIRYSRGKKLHKMFGKNAVDEMNWKYIVNLNNDTKKIKMWSER